MTNESEYWKKRGEQYADELRRDTQETKGVFKQQEDALKKIAQNLHGVETVLEIGCGTGRATKVMLDNLPDCKKYLATDVSSGQIKHFKETAAHWWHEDQLQFKVADYGTELFERFDLVFASEVFLHVHPKRIKYFLWKAQNDSDKYLIHIDPLQQMRKDARHRLYKLKRALLYGDPLETNWRHDYLTLYDYSSIDDVRVVPIDFGRIGIHVVKKKQAEI